MQLKQKIIDGFVEALAETPYLNRKLYTFSNLYIDRFRNYSYDFSENGEQRVIDAFSRACGSGVTFFDVGANVGEWTRYFVTKIPEGRGHLFELTPRTYQRLKENHGKNPALSINNFALSDKNGPVSFINYGEGDGGNTMLTGADYHRKDHSIETAQAETGDSYCDRKEINRIHFLKIDTEGVEYSVLKGLEKMIAAQKVDVIQFEYGYTHGDAGTLMRDFFTFFEKHGYCVGRLTKKGVVFKSFEYSDNDFKSGPNYVACLPVWKSVLARF